MIPFRQLTPELEVIVRGANRSPISHLGARPSTLEFGEISKAIKAKLMASSGCTPTASSSLLPDVQRM